jgi:hypothetical protein
MLCNFDDFVFRRYMAGSQLRVGVFFLKPRTWPDGKKKKHGLLFDRSGLDPEDIFQSMPLRFVMVCSKHIHIYIEIIHVHDCVHVEVRCLFVHCSTHSLLCLYWRQNTVMKFE